MSDVEYETCERCGAEIDNEFLHTVNVDGPHDLCDGCITDLNESIKYFEWDTRYSEDDHQRAMDALSESDHIDCVIGSYEDAAIVVHTPYVSSDAVTDICRHFGHQITGYGPTWPEDQNPWECVYEHGPMFEVVLRYRDNSPSPVPEEFEYYRRDARELGESDKQF